MRNPSWKVVLLDDEFLALQLLEQFFEDLENPNWTIVAKFKSPQQAIQYLLNEEVDLLLLDIQMPGQLGTTLLEQLSGQPPVAIFTTAYADYAPEAFSLNAVDYLLKPFSFERFEQAIAKAADQLRLRALKQRASPLTIKVEGSWVKIELKEILYIEGMKEYVRLVCRGDKKYLTLAALQELEERLPHQEFMRVHKSYIVARTAVWRLSGYKLQVGEQELPVSRSKKEQIKQWLFEK